MPSPLFRARSCSLSGSAPARAKQKLKRKPETHAGAEDGWLWLPRYPRFDLRRGANEAPMAYEPAHTQTHPEYKDHLTFEEHETLNRASKKQLPLSN